MPLRIADEKLAGTDVPLLSVFASKLRERTAAAGVIPFLPLHPASLPRDFPFLFLAAAGDIWAPEHVSFQRKEKLLRLGFPAGPGVEAGAGVPFPVLAPSTSEQESERHTARRAFPPLESETQPAAAEPPLGLSSQREGGQTAKSRVSPTADFGCNLQLGRRGRSSSRSESGGGGGRGRGFLRGRPRLAWRPRGEPLSGSPLIVPAHRRPLTIVPSADWKPGLIDQKLYPLL